MATREEVIIDLEIDTKDVDKSQDDVEKLTRKITSLEDAIKKNKQEMKKSNEELAKAGTSRRKLAVDIAKEQQMLAKARRERTQNIKVIKAEDKSLNALMAATNKMVASRNKQNLATAKGRKEFAKLTTQINKNNIALKKYDEQISRNQRNVGNYPTTMQKVQAGFGKMSGAIGIAIGTIAALNAALQHTFELSKIVGKVGKLFDVTGLQAEEMAARVSALSTALETDYKEVLVSANAVSKEFGISGSEALDLIEEGFKKGSNNSGQFLDILKEYPVFFKKAGLSAEEAFAVINQQVTAGVYSDKGIDAIKEADLALRENTKTARAALSVLDEGVQAQIKQEVAAGNTFKAMQLISTEMKTAGLTASETGAIMADVFKGAGEDSYSFVENLDNIELSLDNVANQTTIVEDSTLKMDTAWNSFLLSVESGEGFVSQFVAGAKTGFASLLESITDLNNGQVSWLDTLKRSGLLGAGFQAQAEGQILAEKELLRIEREKEEQIIKTANADKTAADDALNNTESEIEGQKKANDEADKGKQALTKTEERELKKREKANESYQKNVAAGEIKLRELQIKGMQNGYDKELAILQLKQDKEQARLTKSLENQEQLNAALLLSDSNYLAEKAALYEEFFEVDKEITLNALEQNTAANELELETLRIQEEAKLLIKDEFRTQEKEKETIFEDERFQKAVEIANAGVEFFQIVQDRKLAALDQREAQEIAAAGDNEEKKLQIEKKYAQEKYKIIKRQFIADKALKVANAGIDIAAAVIANLKNPIMAALVGILGAVQLASIIATPPPPAPTFADGGTIVQGGSHASGSDVGIYGDNGQYYGRVEGGEMMTVMSKNSTQALAMSNFNQQHGGRSFFSKPQAINADGGSLAPQSQQQDLSVVVDAIRDMNISVNVNDINDAQTTQVIVEDNASF